MLICVMLVIWFEFVHHVGNLVPETDLCLSLLVFLHFMEKCLFYVTLQSLENNINKEFFNHFVMQRIFQRKDYK